MEEYDTLKQYNDNAEKYFEKTKNGDMSDGYNRFLLMLPDKAYILDFGCGSGRDSKYFLEKGYVVKAIDGSEKLCELASDYIGQKVECMKFNELSDESKYDGIWACSSIHHVERKDLPDVLRKMIKALKDGGVIFASFMVGDQEKIRNGKYFNFITKEILENILKQIDSNSEIVDYYESEMCKGVNIKSDIWGGYLIKKKKR